MWPVYYFNFERNYDVLKSKMMSQSSRKKKDGVFLPIVLS